MASSLSDVFSVDCLNVTALDIAHCTGCGSCSSAGTCRFDDDMSKVLRAFDDADVIIFATPVRFNGMSSQIKTVVDRFQLLWNFPDTVEHRRRFMGLMMTAGSDRPDPTPNLKVFRSFCLSFGGVWAGSVVLSGTDFGDVDYDGCARRMADQLIESINGA